MAKMIKIGWLFPNIFNLHGDRGNILAIKAEGERRRYDIEIEQINLDTKNFNPLEYDFLFCPPGEMQHFGAVVAFLEPYKDKLIDFIENRPMLVTGTTISLFGNMISRNDGSTIRGLGIVNTEATENRVVYGDDLHYNCRYNGKELEIIGSQIQMMDIEINEESSFGWLRYGYGNTGNSKHEGVISGKAIFTNTLGPMLVCNPWLTEEILNLIESNKGWETWEKQRNNSLESNSLKTKTALIIKKETHLKKVSER